MPDNTMTIKISVRNLVEFIMQSGSIDNTRSGKNEVDAMQAGSRIHKKLQKAMGTDYTPEVPLNITVPVTYDGMTFDLTIDGRADGIIMNNLIKDDDFSTLLLEEEECNKAEITIDEIKGVYMELNHLKEPVTVHRAQAMCYAYIYGVTYQHSWMGIRLTYCNLETESLKYFEEVFSIQELHDWFDKLVNEYAKWAVWQKKWIMKRNEEISNLDFPFPYREGQKELVTGVYKTILRKKNLFIEAPTGVGKTISTVYPTVKAMGMGIVKKIFYLTAKTITRTVAEDTFNLLSDYGLGMKVATITAKDKVCILDKPDCNPISCSRAKGHYDRVNDAVYDLLTCENKITRDLVLFYAEKHNVCPFEMSLDVTMWSDAVICDYNYVFDPNVYLRRFFTSDKQEDYVFLIDEAHNLVDRAREMYSATLYKDDFLIVKRLIKDTNIKLAKLLDFCNKDLLQLKRECDEFEIVQNVDGFCMHLMGLMTEYEAFLQEYKKDEGRQEILQLYMDIRHFLNMFESLDDYYTIYTDYDDTDSFRIKLQCMDPSRKLLKCYEKGRSAVLFSATLLPIRYYMELLGGRKDDYAVYAPSSFAKENRLVMVGSDVSTKYSRRNKREYERILKYIKEFTDIRTGNYMVFFPSYQMMQSIYDLVEGEISGIVMQSGNMTEGEREAFLEEFVEDPKDTRVGFCVMGGIFSEGIDLKNSRLIGAVVVGTGLPMVCNERELFRGYFDAKNGRGFDYSYLYQGMNKVLQSAGRVIRTIEDRGAILLLDERFLNSQYYKLFPEEWFPFEPVDVKSMGAMLSDFWNKV